MAQIDQPEILPLEVAYAEVQARYAAVTEEIREFTRKALYAAHHALRLVNPEGTFSGVDEHMWVTRFISKVMVANMDTVEDRLSERSEDGPIGWYNEMIIHRTGNLMAGKVRKVFVDCMIGPHEEIDERCDEMVDAITVKFDANNMPFKMGHIKADSIKQMLYEFIPREGISIKVVDESKKGHSPAHVGIFKEVLFELISNASTAMQNGGEINLTIGEDDENMHVSVNNPGVIDPEVLPHIFEYGFTTKEHGTGKGLYFNKRYVEEYLKGALTATSTEAEGTTLKISLKKTVEDKRKLS